MTTRLKVDGGKVRIEQPHNTVNLYPGESRALLIALAREAGAVEVEICDGLVRDWPLVRDGPALVIPMEDE